MMCLLKNSNTCFRKGGEKVCLSFLLINTVWNNTFSQTHMKNAIQFTGRNHPPALFQITRVITFKNFTINSTYFPPFWPGRSVNPGYQLRCNINNEQALVPGRGDCARGEPRPPHHQGPLRSGRGARFPPENWAHTRPRRR